MESEAEGEMSDFREVVLKVLTVGLGGIALGGVALTAFAFEPHFGPEATTFKQGDVTTVGPRRENRGLLIEVRPDPEGRGRLQAARAEAAHADLENLRARGLEGSASRVGGRAIAKALKSSSVQDKADALRGAADLASSPRKAQRLERRADRMDQKAQRKARESQVLADYADADAADAADARASARSSRARVAAILGVDGDNRALAPPDAAED